MKLAAIKEFFQLLLSGNFKKLKSKLLIKFGNEETLFTEFYKKNVWGSKESLSGPGSERELTKNIITELPKLLSRYNIESVIDAPCGDFNFMKFVNLGNINYLGCDIVKEVVLTNNQLYTTNSIKFKHINVIEEILPKADLIFSRDMFIHFSFEHIQKTIQNFKVSGAKYLLTNTYPEIEQNINIKTGSWRPLNFSIEPFCFQKPIEQIIDCQTKNEGVKMLALYKLNEI